MQEDNHPSPPKHLKTTHPGGGSGGDDGGDDDDDDDGNVELPEGIIRDIFTYLDVQDLVVKVKPVCHLWKDLATTVIDEKGKGTTRKVFKTRKELRDTVIRYCPAPQGEINETMTQQYCNREIAEEIACTYGWPINKWNVSQIRDFTSVLSSRFVDLSHELDTRGVSLFNEDINGWDVSQARTMDGMFYNSKRFNQDLPNWNVSNVTDMKHMFWYAEQFNGNIKTWDVKNVTNMYGMFADTQAFNQDLSTWSVSDLTSMNRMFHNATQINRDTIANWDRWNVTNEMFEVSDIEYSDSDSDIEYSDSDSDDSDEIIIMRFR